MKPLRPGVVLVATLLLLVALALLAAGLIRAAEQSRLTANARLDITRAHLASESATSEALASWSTRRLADLPIGAVRPIPPDSSPESAVTAQHLSGDVYLVSAHGFAPFGRHARASAGALVLTLSLRSLWQPLGSALQAGGDVALDGGRVTGREAGVAPPGWSNEDCAPARDSMTTIFADTARPGIALPPSASVRRSAGTVDGTPQTIADAGLQDTLTFQRLGPLSPANFAEIADRLEHGTIRLAPSSQGLTCSLAAPANWGDPLSQTSPCANYFPLIYADGDLTIAAGAGQGVLIVAGNLVLSGGAQFYGPILVAGTLSVGEGASIYGSIRARGKAAGIHIRNATIAYNACALFRALRGSPALDRAFRPGPRLWIPLF